MRGTFISWKRAGEALMVVTVIFLLVNAAFTSEHRSCIMTDRTVDDLSGEPIWIFDSDLYVMHVATADLDGDGTLDVVGGEYDMTYYGEPSRVYALDGASGDVPLEQGRLRGLCVVADHLVAVGSSPPTITLFDVDAAAVVARVNFSTDLRHGVHGLQAWPD